MELLVAFIVAFVFTLVAIFYFIVAVVGLFLPIIFWIFVIWLIIRLIKKYT